MDSPSAYLDASKEYSEFLLDLTFNSKPIIDNLTAIAAENKHAASAIVKAIESRIAAVSPDKKLPALYLLDSIVKNVGEPYRSLFEKNLQTTFLSAFRTVPKAVRQSMMRLLETWPPYFGNNLISLLKVRANEVQKQIQENTKGYEAVHVNPQVLLRTTAGNSHVDTKPQNYNVSYLERAQEKVPVPKPKENRIPAFLRLQQHGILNNNSEPTRKSSSKQASGVHSRLDTSSELMKQLQVETQLLVDTINAQLVRGMMPTQEQLNALQALVTVILQYANFNIIAQNFVPYLQQHTDNIVNQIKTLQENQQAQEQEAVIANAIQSLMSGYNSQLVPQNSESSLLVSERKIFPNNSKFESDVSSSCQVQDEIITDFNILRRLDHGFIVCKLYDDLQIVSESDGSRFATREDLRQHLDWLFEWNKRLRARRQGGICRMWYSSVHEWIQGTTSVRNSGMISSSMIFEDGTSQINIDKREQQLKKVDEEANQTHRHENKVFAGDCEDRCFVCGDCFEMEWDDELEALVYKDAIKEGGDEGTKIFHVDCYSVWKSQGGSHDWKSEDRDKNANEVEDSTLENFEHKESFSGSDLGFEIKAEPTKLDASEDFPDGTSDFPQKRLRTKEVL
ncbi:Pre-mRNA cleavage complex 2 protein Pcf11 [Galdieria sulphuraria]|uniref:CID domain-containing protein n=1 Tax=Galdieria sulphuraria TaxID=130081 RepID=M2XQA7_GALSU|nr:uncharacterized protein Gasu_04940 [Galdieria sulphuraria]EME32407.1 hypothetical protein Gasu_04940 [Galdieria sulphuraria]GJD06098.1 Pre-mRNA cleavage complex 2 protein Pcf11 [Galdieria sulphuraria]|eukprot:XP_005708927.1 hypothetical protein Gasu_04940 [Galdieria sulphuraria]